VGLTLAKVFYHFCHSASPFYSVLGIFEMGSQELFAQAGFELQSS
jgi:hypothetical protein